jgi:hypothetical protein
MMIPGSSVGKTRTRYSEVAGSISFRVDCVFSVQNLDILFHLFASTYTFGFKQLTSCVFSSDLS